MISCLSGSYFGNLKHKKEDTIKEKFSCYDIIHKNKEELIDFKKVLAAGRDL